MRARYELEMEHSSAIASVVIAVIAYIIAGLLLALCVAAGIYYLHQLIQYAYFSYSVYIYMHYFIN